MSEASYQQMNITTSVMGIGGGCRYTVVGVSDRVFPYIQASVLNISEQVEATLPTPYGTLNLSDSKSGFGFAVNAGIEIRLGRLVSVPIEGMYLYGKPADDVSGYGFTAGISFNWGKI